MNAPDKSAERILESGLLSSLHGDFNFSGSHGTPHPGNQDAGSSGRDFAIGSAGRRSTED